MTSIEEPIIESPSDGSTVATELLAEKDREIQRLKTRIEVLEDLLNRLSAQRIPQAQGFHALKPAPRRWNVR